MLKTGIGIRFPGTCEKAFNFYKSVFGGEFIDFIKIGDDPYTRENSPKEEHGKVAYVALQVGNMIIGADDAPDSAIKQLTSGNMLSIGLVPDSKKEADRLFKALSASGNITSAPTEYPWGYLGGLIDKFGISWGVWYRPPPAKQP
jgi:PhnB protein